jgi:hypothetical protein
MIYSDISKEFFTGMFEYVEIFHEIVETCKESSNAIKCFLTVNIFYQIDIQRYSFLQNAKSKILIEISETSMMIHST